MIYADFEITLMPGNKNILLAVIVINQYVSMINSVNLLNITKVNMLFTILLIGWRKKVNFLLIL